MLGVGHAADHRSAHGGGDGQQVALRGEAGDDAICVAVEDARDVGRRLPLAQPDLVTEQRDRVPTETVDGHLERHPGAVARSLEDERQVETTER